ncbi:1,4-dihydroxy-2-naphthoate octaprenyltransferase [Rhodoblastus sp.]|jgi:1,4-dihydroxy-2-naphthoate octaprenyltransferase|uniref:1,4-dihydroxy-2-naphthoate octaprenyltransferase n=1 Tax=Rhodoblastus sp. TaxID=1962975 RepID=UPI00262BB4D0|nr:1,4-dihydroxy-2-naphthoate octaprenyltransferase [Rhodoblastus sp.]
MSRSEAGATRLANWIAAMRPRTLSMALAPVFLGACLAQAFAGHVDLAAVGVAAFSAVCIQIATNLFNDVRDFERGGDGPDRLGPRRAAASGLLAPGEIKGAAYGFFALAALGGLYLAAVGGWPILVLGALSIVAGWAYTGGPAPISYTPLGELFVIAFFGLGAVGGTFWLSAGALAPEALIAGLALGLFAAGVLMVNNYRDAAADARIGRRTLAIVAGPSLSRALYAAMLFAPFLLAAFLVVLAPRRASWLAFGALPMAWGLVRKLDETPPGLGLNLLLARTAQTQALFASLLGIGVLIEF